MKKLFILFSIIFFNLSVFAQAPTAAWINEIHYDNTGSDVGEFIEVVVNESFSDLTNFQVYLYNGSSSSGTFYDSLSLDQFQIGTTTDGFTFYVDSIPGIQNGSPDGMAIAYNNILIPGQFLSYEGTFTGVGGPADGIESIDIGVAETSSPIGSSLGLTGSGTEYTSFAWDTLETATPGAPNGTQALPVELTSFSAINLTNGVRLKWNTATEINNSGFDIERSSNNRSFHKIAFIHGHGTSSEASNYSYVDNSASGKMYYRLKQIDYDGSYNYSKTIEVNSTNAPINFNLSQNYPNPFNPNTTINFSIPKSGNVLLRVYNVLGQQVRTLINGFMESGLHTVNFNAQGLESGLYFYKLETEGFNQVKKMTLLK